MLRPSFAKGSKRVGRTRMIFGSQNIERRNLTQNCQEGWRNSGRRGNVFGKKKSAASARFIGPRSGARAPISIFPMVRDGGCVMGRRRQGPVEGRVPDQVIVQYAPRAARCTLRIFGLISQLAAVRQIEVYALHAADTTARPRVTRYCTVGRLSEK